MTTEDRPLRADAERNRQAIICAAGSVFAAEGTGVTLEHIAEIAGVGVGTIYRRFPTVQALVEVVLEEKMTRYADRSEEAAEQARTEPWEAFRDYVLFILEQQADDLAFTDVIMTPGTGTSRLNQEGKRAFRATLQLVERAKRSGAIRPDFDHSDLYLMLQANGGLVRGTQRLAPLAWRRFGEYLLQAFRERGPEALTPPSEIWRADLPSPPA
jgi:AcrR family transcriptional regulator